MTKPPSKTATKLTATFEAFLGSAKAARFRQSDVADLLYPLTRPRDRAVARDTAAALIREAAKASRIERTEHLHWKVRPVSVTRTLRDGRVVPEVAGLTALTLSTRCPGKWVAIDLETGQLWEGSAKGWERASHEVSATVVAIAQTLRDQAAA